VCKRAIDLYFNRRRPWDVQRIGKDWCCIKRSGRCRRYVLRGRKRALEKAQTHGSLSRHSNNNNISGCESHRAALSLGALALEQSLGDDEVWTNDCFSSVGPSTGMTGMRALSRPAVFARPVLRLLGRLLNGMSWRGEGQSRASAFGQPPLDTVWPQRGGNRTLTL